MSLEDGGRIFTRLVAELTGTSLRSTSTRPASHRFAKLLVPSFKSTLKLLCAFSRSLLSPAPSDSPLLHRSWYGPIPLVGSSKSTNGGSNDGASINGTATNGKKRKKGKAARRAETKRQKRASELEPDVDDPLSYSPVSPDFQRDVSLPPIEAALVAVLPVAIAGPQLPTPATFVPPPPPPTLLTHKLPTSFPPPPPIIDVEPPAEGEGPEETPAELLQAALWAWYNAGYQTGLYHAAMGVAGLGTGAEGDVDGAGQE